MTNQRNNASFARRASFALPLVLLAPAMLRGQDEGSVGAHISVDVNLVVLHPTVRDPKGGFVSGLTENDFHVFEDGKPQTIHLFRHEDVPVSVGLIVDSSTSMGPKRNDVIAGVLGFIHSSNQEDELFVVNFNEKPKLGLPPDEPFTSSATDLELALDSMPAGGRTALYDAIEEGLSHLKLAHREKKALIVFSDGGDNASHHNLLQVLGNAERLDVLIYTIGLFDEEDPDRNPGVLRKISRATGGEVYLPAETRQTVSICEQIAADLRHQYTIVYVPSNPKMDSTYRTIKVTATNPRGGKLLVRTREGYIAGAQK